MDGVAEVAEGGEWPGHLDVGDRFVADVEGFEDSLVEQAADGVVGALVEVVEVFAEDFQGEVEGGGDVLVAEVQAGDQGFGVLAAFTQAGLLVVEELAGDAVFVVHVQELAFLVFDFVKDAVAAVDLLLGDLGALVEVVGDHQVGRAIQQLRSAQGLTIDDLATTIDVSAEQLARIEDGLRDPTWTTLYRLAVGLDTTTALMAYAIETEQPTGST